MNHIYKVIWSKAKHTYVVVSEIAKNHSGKTAAGKKAILAAVLAAMTLTGAAIPAYAADTAKADKAAQDALLLLAQNAKSEDDDAKADAGENGSENEAGAQKTVYNENGFYAKQNANTGRGEVYNSLTKDGLWVGGATDDEGFHVDNDGNAKTTGTVDADDLKIEGASFKDAGLVPGTVDRAPGSIALGDGASVSSDTDEMPAFYHWGIAIGDSAGVKNSSEGVAIGAKGKVTNSANGVSVGSANSVTDSNAGVVVGSVSHVSNSNSGVALGNMSYVEHSNYSTALGSQAHVLGTEGSEEDTGYGTAVGFQAVVNQAKNSVALGAGSSASGSDLVETDDHGIVSVGSSTDTGNGVFQRRIINVKDGNIAEGSHDAVTGGQLFPVKTYTDTLKAAGVVGGKVDPSSPSSLALGEGAEVKKEAASSVAIGKYATVNDNSKNSTAVGQGAGVYRAGATAIGQGADVYGKNGLAIGYNSSVAIATGKEPTNSSALGTNALVEGAQNSVALGTNSIVEKNDDNVVSVGAARGQTNPDGTKVEAFTRKIINVTDGNIAEGSHEAVTGGQLFPVKNYTDALQAAGVVGGKVGGENDVAIGTESFASGNQATAVGYNSNAWKDNSAAYGVNSSANGEGSVAIGSSAGAYSKNSIALGTRAQVSTEGSENGIAIGTEAYSYDKDAIALGAQAKAFEDESAAIGKGAIALGKNSVALGAGSTADAENTVSVGQSGTNGFQRKIVNVADGTVAEGSHDAVTGGQLYSTNKDLAAANEKLDKTYFVADANAKLIGNGVLENHAFNLTDGINLNTRAIEKETQARADADAVFTDTFKAYADAGILPGKITGGKYYDRQIPTERNIVIGKDASSNDAEDGIVIGTYANVDMKDHTNPNWNQNSDGPWNAIAIGRWATVENSANGVSIGAYSTIKESHNSVAVGARLRVENSLRGTAYGDEAHLYSAKDGTAIGTLSEVVNDSLPGQQGGETPIDSGTAIGARAASRADYSVALGADSIAKNKNEISVGHRAGDTYRDEAYEQRTYDKDLFRKITNVADGTDDHDAVTYGQVKGVINLAGRNGNDETNLALGKDSYTAAYYDQEAKKFGNSNNTAIGVKAQISVSSSQNSTAVGNNASIQNGTNATAIGQNASIHTDNGTAIGQGAVVAFEAGNQGSIALGQGSAVVWGDHNDKDTNGVLSVGKTGAFNRRIINVADGINDHDAATVGQLNAATGSLGKLDKAGIVAGNVGTSKNSLAIGKYSKAGGNNATTVGQSSGVLAAGGTALGYNANIYGDGKYAVAVGSSSAVDHAYGVALGTSTAVEADKGTALGYGAKVYGANSTALGTDSYVAPKDVTEKDPNGVISVGRSAGAQWSGDEGFTRRIINVANGIDPTDAVNKSQLDAVATTAGKGFTVSVAQPDGSFQKHTYKPGETITVTGTNANILAGIDGNGAFHVSLNDNLKVKTLAADDITIGGKSLAAAGIEAGDTEGATEDTWSLALGKDSSIVGLDGVAKNYSVAIGVGANVQADNSTAVGTNATNNGLFSTSVGEEATGAGDYATALGGLSYAYKNGTAIGTRALAETNAVAIGADSTATKEGTVSFGHAKGDEYTADDGTTLNYKDDLNRTLTHVGAGFTAFDAVNAGQFNGFTPNGTGTGTYAEGASFLNAVDKIDWKAVAERSEAINGEISKLNKNKDAQTGKTASTEKLSVKSLAKADISLASSVKPTILAAETGTEADKNDGRNPNPNGGTTTGGGDKSTSFNNGITVKGDSSFTGNVDFTKAASVKVKDGKVEKDSKEIVNGGQLYDEQQARQNADTALGNQIGALGGRVNELGGEIDSVGAISAALAGLHPIDYDPTGAKFQLSAAFGTYDGSSAFALGGFYNVNKDTLLSAGVSTVLKGDRKTSANLGLTVRLGAGSSAGTASAETLGEANQRLAALSSDNKVLEGQNRKLTEKVDAQDQTIKDQGQKIAEQGKQLSEQDQKLKDLEAKLNALLSEKK